MNEQDRAELEGLKRQQAELLAQFVQLGRNLSSLEGRLMAAAPGPEPAKPKPAPATPPPLPLNVPPVIQKSPPALGVQEMEIPALEPTPIESSASPEPHAPRPERKEFAAPPVMMKVALPIPSFARSKTAGSPPKPTTTPQEKDSSFEMRLGTYWLVRIGIVMLLTGLVFFANYAYHNYIAHIGPAGKVALLYVVSGGLLGVGTWLQRNKDLKNYAEVLFAGGLAAVYFTTYAAHHVKNLIVIHSAVTDGSLLLAWAGFIIWIADRKKSEVLALFAVLLAYYTSIISHVGLFTLYSNLLLTVAAVYFLVRNRWATVSFASLVATYISYGFWRFYQDGHWHLVEPSEGLWTGNYFLMAYWAVFTAAVFLSRSEHFFGQRRAAFLSLNNAAFFSAFIFTMWQVDEHGFWKFSLAYGSALLASWILARTFLAEDRLCQNAYLTQGLLLVTLGFITYFTGMILGLVLATESVILTLIGKHMKSRVMRYASMLAALLSVGWAMASLDPHHLPLRDDIIKGIAIGAAMLFNAFWLDRDKTWEENRVNLRNIFYTALALGMWFFTSWRFSGHERRGALLAAEAIAFVVACRPLRNQTLRDGACLFAAAATGWEVYYLADQYLSIELVKRAGLAPGIIVGASMILCALWEKSIKRPDQPEKLFLPAVTLFSSFGLIAWLAATAVFTPREYLAPLLALEALALTASHYLLRLKELPLFGQAFLIFAQAVWLIDAIANGAHRPWWNPTSVIAITLALAQWSQRQKSLTLDRSIRLLMQGVYALAAVGLFYYWLEPQFTAPTWLALASGLAIILTAYAAFNRYWLLAAAGQIFLLVSGYEFAQQLWNGEPAWYVPLAPIATFCLLSFCAMQWFATRPNADASVRDSILQIGQVYRIVALIMSLWWVHKYVAARELCWTLVAIGSALFTLAGWRRNRELLIFSAVFTVFGIARFWAPMDDAPRVYLPNLFAMLLLLAQQRVARRLAGNFPAPSQAHSAAIALAGVSLWFLLSRWIIEKPGDFYLTLTAGWALLALVLFVTGMAMRERMYRWVGLGILAAALGRVVFVEVWKLETIFKILSFTALGIVLLVLGFIYNKYQEKIKEWL
jgi:uncharacterized membrane protein